MLDDAELDAIEARANAQAAGYARMSELDGGIGVLGVRHPKMYEDMLTWQRSTENEHADTVLALLRDLRAARVSHSCHPVPGGQAAAHLTVQRLPSMRLRFGMHRMLCGRR